jgi:hypothetical protein
LERRVNERQLSVLQWVGAGCPAGVWNTSSYKTTCQALHNRGLVTVSRKAGQWSVALTSVGRHYLAHGTYPPRGSRPRKTQAAGPRPTDLFGLLSDADPCGRPVACGTRRVVG